MTATVIRLTVVRTLLGGTDYPQRGEVKNEAYKECGIFEAES